jgi:hypothetical protein
MPRDYTPPPPHKRRPDKAEHGYRNEVNWNGGQGRQPYANQGEAEAPPPNQGDEVEAGDRGEHSGTHQQQDEQVRKRP